MTQCQAGRVAGKVVLITGGARGQGRAHAVALAAEGADVVVTDLCADIASAPYPMGTAAELAETAEQVAKHGHRVLTRTADVRDPAAMRAVTAEVIAEFGRLDVLVAQAGIAPLGSDRGVQAMLDAVDVDLVGAINTINAAVPHLAEGASIIATGSLAALRPRSGGGAGGPGAVGYKYAKLALAQYVHELATVLAPQRIRVNCVHPTNVDTPMLQNSGMYKLFRPDLDDPSREDAEQAFPVMQAMPVPYVAVEDVSAAVLYLASDESRYVTGMQLRIDAGGYLNVADFRP
ncbi:MAG TPA: mycofactocin-coupled SDR family oxidoreductase [Sporichthyaceae bacterium]|nr:mycofactocin-coupled SDR family oxidoreductase [Sporichthyaceae bacterium]